LIRLFSARFGAVHSLGSDQKSLRGRLIKHWLAVLKAARFS
jgi:hypothetical protein